MVPVTLPWEDIEVAMQTGELDGIAWCGATELHTVGWANVTKYYLTNNINGAWIGSYFANAEKWNALPEHLKALFQLAMDSSNYYRQHWYWWGEAHYRTTGGKLELTHDPGRGMGDVAGRGAEVLGRGRRRERAQGQGCADPQGLRRASWRRPARPTATADGSAPERLRLAQALPSVEEPRPVVREARVQRAEHPADPALRRGVGNAGGPGAGQVRLRHRASFRLPKLSCSSFSALR